MQCVWKRGVSKHHYTSAKSIFSKERRLKAPPYQIIGKGVLLYREYVSIIKMILRVPRPFIDIAHMGMIPINALSPAKEAVIVTGKHAAEFCCKGFKHFTF